MCVREGGWRGWRDHLVKYGYTSVCMKGRSIRDGFQMTSGHSSVCRPRVELTDEETRVTSRMLRSPMSGVSEKVVADDFK